MSKRRQGRKASKQKASLTFSALAVVSRLGSPAIRKGIRAFLPSAFRAFIVSDTAKVCPTPWSAVAARILNCERDAWKPACPGLVPRRVACEALQGSRPLAPCGVWRSAAGEGATRAIWPREAAVVIDILPIAMEKDRKRRLDVATHDICGSTKT
eukprot:CAMPEP_0117687678 /NCGR_PEP_ID=MMETSP0804-20121206/23284_1 /TAXON_ID=1074897 /ORGANISM="Tetraselmis astigmatica, Strain CCMP880" /LENGTH=154 /DNA_ID=CAMNT_0005499799 /DNA_START=277 /DNA_END=737 /DNA_ORIENTATION=+